MDYNFSRKDQIFARVSWDKENRYVKAVLGPVFDGGGTDNDGTFDNYGKNAVISWNHVFSPTLINQARFSYNWGYWTWFEQSYNNGALDAQYGLGGLAPYSASLGNGGLPQIWVNEFPEIGPPLFQPSPEGQNGYQIIDDVTKVLGNHTLKAGADIRRVRDDLLQGNNNAVLGIPADLRQGRIQLCRHANRAAGKQLPVRLWLGRFLRRRQCLACPGCIGIRWYARRGYGLHLCIQPHSYSQRPLVSRSLLPGRLEGQQASHG